MENENSNDGGGDGLGGGDEDPTVVIVPRIPRPTVSRGLRILGTAFKELRRAVFELADQIDRATALGAIDLTEAEAAEVDDYLFDAERQISGIRGSLKRASGSGPTKEP